ncbi:hypothetical protein Golob_021901 [Gossypium lobatum]|uniref:RNase H type-1 domain-containing protein n=1 Tax=Gossypium lobatum TaxID=34289 RepID=A0A7J8LEZ5_9ROSI|nr:hypothetical protein [Gossypium lobatum]
MESASRKPSGRCQLVLSVRDYHLAYLEELEPTIFQGLSWSSDEVTKASPCWAKYYVSVLGLHVTKFSGLDFVLFSLDGWVYLNTDGSVKSLDMFAAAGRLLRDHNGDWIVGFTRYLGNCEVIDSELWGILHGLQIALDRSFQKVIIQTDNLEAVDLIHERVYECSNFALVRRILSFLKLSSHWNLQHIPREDNRIADKIVKLRQGREPGLLLDDKNYVMSFINI